MDYDKDGVTASVTVSEDGVDIADFEIDEGLVMAFGESGYLPALQDFIRWLDDLEAREYRVPAGRSGFNMLLARFGFALERGHMVKRPGDAALAERARRDAVMFDAMPGSTFEDDSLVEMADGSTCRAGELDIGDEVARGGQVISIMRGRQRAGIDIGTMRCGGGGAIFHDGAWIRMRDHPRASSLYLDEGWSGVTIGTRAHLIVVDGELFADFFETDGRMAELAQRSEEALGVMNAQDGV